MGRRLRRVLGFLFDVKPNYSKEGEKFAAHRRLSLIVTGFVSTSLRTLTPTRPTYVLQSFSKA
jgi:hypothetical protein